VDPDVERRQIDRVRSVRASRSAAGCQSALARVVQTARTDANLVPAIIEAVEAKATLGEVADALRDVFGEYAETAAV